jgi:hypothetical protein
MLPADATKALLSAHQLIVTTNRSISYFPPLPPLLRVSKVLFDFLERWKTYALALV